MASATSIYDIEVLDSECPFVVPPQCSPLG